MSVQMNSEPGGGLETSGDMEEVISSSSHFQQTGQVSTYMYTGGEKLGGPDGHPGSLPHRRLDRPLCHRPPPPPCWPLRPSGGQGGKKHRNHQAKQVKFDFFS